MAITNLYSIYDYPDVGDSFPLLLLIHGWSSGADFYDSTFLSRMAGYGFFAVSIGMRGRNNAGGSQDASGREVYDIYDAIATYKAAFGSLISSDICSIMGLSGGGGSALAFACKFPDAVQCVVSYFGMSDYGRDPTNSWYYNNPGVYTADIADWVGGTPLAVPNNYYARDATAAIQNFTGGQLHLFHSPTDIKVPYVHSQRIAAAMDNYSLTNYTTYFDEIYDHDDPINDPVRITSEANWTADALASSAWTVPASGTVTVIGYIVTKLFTIWLNSNGESTLGIDAVATVVYNTATNSYTITPLTTGGVDVSVTQGAKTGSATNISAETEIIVA